LNYGSEYVCGHNIFNHDLKYIRNALIYAGLDDPNIIDTLFLSPLLFPARPYHKLLKDDKLQTEDINNLLNDSIKAKDLFFDEIAVTAATLLGMVFYAPLSTYYPLMTSDYFRADAWHAGAVNFAYVGGMMLWPRRP